MQFRYLSKEWNDIYKLDVFGQEPCRIVPIDRGFSYWRARSNEIGVTLSSPQLHAHLAHEIGHKKCKAAANTHTKEWQIFILEICAWDYALMKNPELPTSFKEKGKWHGLITYVQGMREVYGREGWKLAKQAVVALLEKHGQAWNPAWDKIK